jgi:fatty-acyl-CoA synthase
LLAAVYAVPNEDVGDDVMASLLLGSGQEFDPAGFAGFLAAQRDLGSKWAPRYVRIARELPTTPSNKILKRELREELWECDDPVFWRQPDGRYRRLEAADVERIRAGFVARGRESALRLGRSD